MNEYEILLYKFCKAVGGGNKYLVKQYIIDGIPLEIINYAMSYAESNLDMIRLLLDNGADWIRIERIYDFNTLKELTEKYNLNYSDINLVALGYSMMGVNLEWAQYLYSKGAFVPQGEFDNWETLMKILISESGLDVYKYLVSLGAPMLPLLKTSES
jgi:hypothetical protein